MRRTALASLAAMTVVATVCSTVGVAAQTDPYNRPGRNDRVSVATGGGQSNSAPATEGWRYGISDLSANGRYVMFTSGASNLVRGDTNLAADVFWHDRTKKITKRVSVASDGSQAILPPFGVSQGYSISADGRYVAFSSDAINLVSGDTNLKPDAFVHDTRTGRTRRVSVSSSGAQGNGRTHVPALSANGRHVAFGSEASNLVRGDTNGDWDVFVHDMKTGKTVRASLASGRTQANGTSGAPSLSANGRYVVFQSSAGNLVPGGGNGLDDVFRHDLKTGKTIRVSVASDGTPASFAALPSCTVGVPPLITLPPPSPIEQVGGVGLPICSSLVQGLTAHSISADGRYVTFNSNATNLVPNDSNAGNTYLGWDTFVHDVKTRRTERASVDSYGRQQGHLRPESSVISATGRYVVMESYGNPECAKVGILPAPADELLCQAGVNAHVTDLYDRLTGAKEPLSVSTSGKLPTPGPCSGSDHALGVDVQMTSGGGITPDGRYVSLQSSGQDMVSGDTNKHCDYFVRDRGPVRGVGGFGGAGNGPGPDTEPFCVTDDVCVAPLEVLASGDAADVGVPGADLIGASAVYRPGFGDAFMRLDLASMPAVVDAPAGGLLYGLRFSVDGKRYEVRVQRAPGADFDANGGASFGLFRQDPVTALFTKVASLKGGYGTTGPSVVFAVPVWELADGRLSDVGAFTGIGSYLSGVTKVLDSVSLAR